MRAMLEKCNKRWVVIAVVVLFFCIAACEEANALPKTVKMNAAVVSDDARSVDVVWYKVKGAKKYTIYRSPSKNGDYVKIGTAKAASRRYTDRHVTKYNTYYYKVKAIVGKSKSICSTPVSAYVGDIDSIADSKLRIKVKFEGGEQITFDSGTGVTTNGQQFIITPEYNGERLTEYTVKYDKGSMTISKKADGTMNVKVKEPGYHVITIDSPKTTGTLILNIEKWVDGNYFSFFWREYREELWPSVLKYPSTKNSMLTMYHNGKKVKNFTVTNSDPSIAKVVKRGSKIIVENKNTGICTFTISDGKHSDEITWVVRRGDPITIRGIDGIPISAHISYEEAKAVITEITRNDYTAKQIKAYADKNPTLDFWKEKLKRPADVVQMLRALDFTNQKTEGKIDNQNIVYNGYDWLSKLSPEENYKQRFVVCLSVSEMMNYILRDKMEEQGYIAYSSPAGGHSFCYYKINGLYVFCDFADAPEKNIPFNNFVVYVTDDKKDFTDYYTKNIAETRDPKAGGYVYVMFMYPMEGRGIPTATNNERYHFPTGGASDILPRTWKGRDINEIVTILYTAPGVEIKYADEPPASIWTFE